ncbi:hypothetical protein [Shewanella atlantica]|uniref:hypothetical protein n=1 Tax=Shewanella atlantica TaxID=271099 RepID=UPI00163A86EB|nr:hypothetical protein [Shewanella atlantica]
MMRASAKTAAAFILSFACLLPLQAFAGISITSYLSAQEPVFSTPKTVSKEAELLSEELLSEELLSEELLSEELLSEELLSEEYKIGVMVKALSRAIASPDAPDSLQIITRYGTDSRYYVMIRGWLVQELSGVQSQLDATKDHKTKGHKTNDHKTKDDSAKTALIERVSFLTKAIRRIDLE